MVRNYLDTINNLDAASGVDLRDISSMYPTFRVNGFRGVFRI